MSNWLLGLTILAEVRILSDDPTRELPQESFQARVLAEFAANRAEFAAIRGELAEIRAEQAVIRNDIATLSARQERFEDRLTSLEEKVDSRLREPRPIWESVQLAIKRLDTKFDIVVRELYEVRTDARVLEKRLIELEAR